MSRSSLFRLLPDFRDRLDGRRAARIVPALADGALGPLIRGRSQGRCSTC